MCWGEEETKAKLRRWDGELAGRCEGEAGTS